MYDKEEDDMANCGFFYLFLDYLFLLVPFIPPDPLPTSHKTHPVLSPQSFHFFARTFSSYTTAQKMIQTAIIAYQRWKLVAIIREI